ncbi:MAG: aminopeptidase P N-terminal domain-containing protein [Deltaproteobacteria bacterium]|nr:aminopeptidase P N-terminal domain-containing protein [Deltaproteobacteria bacterium]
MPDDPRTAAASPRVAGLHPLDPAALLAIYGEARVAPPALVTADRFAARRERLRALCGDDAVIIVPGAAMVGRNSDVEYDFRQGSDFLYLTGFDEPDALAVLRGGEGPGLVLFVRPRDPAAETWTGRRAGLEGAKERFGADAAFDIAELGKHLPALLEGAGTVYWTLGQHTALDAEVIRAAQQHWRAPRGNARGPDCIVDLRAVLHEVRLRKSEEEIVALRAAGRLSAEGHHEAMRVAGPGVWEYQVQAAMELVFRLGGSPRNGYPSIVAGGDNATILHYNTNRMRIPEGGLVLVDAGAEIGYHTADITRTFPASGRFSAAQRAVYDVVLAAEIAAIDVTRPGEPYQRAHDVALRVLTEGLVDLGVLQGSVDGLIEQQAYKPYFMHRTGHWLGMDVHDVGLYSADGQPRPLEPGMVTTVEPGLYFPIDDEGIAAELRGIGIRIEDDVLVTEDGYDVLTEDCVKDPDAVEAMCGEAPRWVRILDAGSPRSSLDPG